jgi:CRISPR type III-B/RAMP module-associated protein Cmr5
MNQAAQVRRIDQTVARAAADLLPQTVSKELRTRYRTLNVMVRTAGLAATYAYVASKANDTGDLAAAYRMVCEGIRDHLERRGLKPATVSGDREMLEYLGGMDLHDYTRASAEVAALTRWLSRLADALYQRDEG